MDKSIILFHNGNSRIVEHYKNKFDLTFSGNWSEATTIGEGMLWEICYADITWERLCEAQKNGITIWRHVSNYDDDQENLLPECESFPYIDWLTHVVLENLAWADVIVNDIEISEPTRSETVVITTGRTANTHLRCHLTSIGKESFEHLNRQELIYPRFLEAQEAIFLWRLDQYACLSSDWISKQTGYEYLHNTNDDVFPDVTIDPVSDEYINGEWFEKARSVMDHVIFFKKILGRPIQHLLTEDITKLYKTVHKPVAYDKKKLLTNYDQNRQNYIDSPIAKIVNTLYNKIIQKLEE